MNFLRACWRVLKAIGRFFFPTSAGMWDLQAQGMRIEGYTDSEIVSYLGPRPEDEV